MLLRNYEKKVICPVEENKSLQDMNSEELWCFCFSEFGIKLDTERSTKQLRYDIEDILLKHEE